MSALSSSSSPAASSRTQELNRGHRLAISLFAVGLIAIGLLSVISRDFAYDWQPIPKLLPGRSVLAVICGLFTITFSLGLLFRRTARLAARAMLPFLIAWCCLKIPAVIAAPQIEGVWIGFGEVCMMLAGGWIIFARLAAIDKLGVLSAIAGNRGIRVAQIIFGLATIPVALGHFFYVEATASLVPTWIPFRVGFAYLTGAGQIACGLGILLSIAPRTAALIETGMLALFAFLVWGPDTWIATSSKLAGTPPGPRFALTAFFVTWIIGASALLIAANSEIARRRPLLVEGQVTAPKDRPRFVRR